MDKHTKIIATLGPAVDDRQTLKELISAGVDIVRINMSHGTHEEHSRRISVIKELRKELGIPLAIMLDTKGPEVRTGLIGQQPITLAKGDTLRLTASDDLPDSSQDGPICVPISPDVLYKSVSNGDDVLLDDGLIKLKVIDVDGHDVICEVLNNAELGQRKSVNTPGISLDIEPITSKDREDLRFGVEQGVDFIAASFIKKASTVSDIKSILAEHGGKNINVIAKIENASAIEDIDQIVRESDGVMVARGDLGVEMPPEEVPYLQKLIIRKCNAAHRPVITATQMLESMISNPRPTRAESADVANAIYDGTDCIMLSGETAVGKYPVDAVRTMVEIAKSSERHYFEFKKRYASSDDEVKSISHAVGTAAVQTAYDIKAKCLICPTMTGRSARLMSSLRPDIPIYAVAPTSSIMRTMQIYWGVHPLRTDIQGSMREVIQNAKRAVVDAGLATVGDIAVLTCGDKFTSPLKLDENGKPEKFAPANVMYVIEIHDERRMAAISNAGEDALMTHAFFDRDELLK